MKSKFNEKIMQPVYHLIAVLEDAKNGYLNAAEKVRDEVLVLFFENFGYQKSRYIKELRQIVSQSDVNPSIDQFTLSLLHRTWRDLKSSFRFGQKEAVIKACIKGEENALENYKTALEQIEDNNELKAILQQQVNGCKDSFKHYKGIFI